MTEVWWHQGPQWRIWPWLPNSYNAHHPTNCCFTGWVSKFLFWISAFSQQAKGHDTSEHVLACFGGAGGQHACAIARALGMKTVFIHKYVCVFICVQYLCVLVCSGFVASLNGMAIRCFSRICCEYIHLWMADGHQIQLINAVCAWRCLPNFVIGSQKL